MSSLEQEDSQPRAFPASYYRHFGGISQLEGMSERVLQSVEGRVCKIYNSICSSLAFEGYVYASAGPAVSLDAERAMWDKYRLGRRAEPPNTLQAALWHRQVLSTYLRYW
jgi:hypothetical protein